MDVVLSALVDLKNSLIYRGIFPHCPSLIGKLIAPKTAGLGHLLEINIIHPSLVSPVCELAYSIYR
jgi:hypothetical protein